MGEGREEDTFNDRWEKREKSSAKETKEKLPLLNSCWGTHYVTKRISFTEGPVLKKGERGERQKTSFLLLWK